MDWALWRRWTITVTIGELAGFIVPALVGVLVTRAEGPASVIYLAMLAAGALEGACLGFAEAWALRHHLPALSRSSFTVATAAGAVLAYGLGMLPSTIGARLTTIPTVLLVFATGTGGCFLLLSIGTAQWLVLRRVRFGSWWWIGATAGAWAAALIVFLLIATPLWRQGQPAALTVAVGVLAGAFMALTAAALTGFAATRLVRDAP